MMSWPNGDRFTGPTYDGDLRRINYGTWTFADGSQLTVDENGQLYRDRSGSPIENGTSVGARLFDFVQMSKKAAWPLGAQERGEAGLTIINLIVDESGKVRDSRIVQSSGYDDLDQAALRNEEDKFYRAASNGSKKVKSALYVSVRWRPDYANARNIPRLGHPDTGPLDMSGSGSNWLHASNTDCWIRNLYAEKPVGLSVNWSGDCLDNVAEGQGTMVWTIDNHVLETYVGQVRDGTYNGTGSWRYEDGSHYDGDYVNGLRQGSGIFTNAENVRYEGGFNQDGFSGSGRLRLSGGPLMEGLFVNDNLSAGKEYFYNGVVYEGPFSNFEPKGPGILHYANGETFEGDFVAKTQTASEVQRGSQPVPARGKFRYLNGIIDDGVMDAGIFSGTRILPDGTRLESFVAAHRDPKAPRSVLQSVITGTYNRQIRAEMTVGADGKVRDVNILTSSGNETEDHRVIRVLENDDHIIAATSNGKPIESWLRVTISF